MLRQIFSGLTFALFLISCNSHQDSNKLTVQKKVDSAGSSKIRITESAKPLTIDTTLLNKYLEAYQNDTISSEKAFFSKLLNIIKDFNGRKLDTTVFTIGNLDGDMGRDTIFSRVYYNSDSVVVDSKWINNNNIIWSYKYADPYYSFDSDLLEGGVRSTWVVFAVGIVYGIPEFYPHREFNEEGDSALICGMGVDDLKSMGIDIRKEDYRTYLRNFKGDLLGFDQPESRERSWIWYKPAARLITYFQP